MREGEREGGGEARGRERVREVIKYLHENVCSKVLLHSG